nr:hypothetical protein [Chitinivorax tropicus]
MLAGVAYALINAPTLGESIRCHYQYGGEQHVVTARATTQPYSVDNLQIGSYFQLRIVFQRTPADLASIKLYVFADREHGPTPIQQASYHYPPARHPRYGFTGLQFIYEPVRDGELQYWCEWLPTNPAD